MDSLLGRWVKPDGWMWGSCLMPTDWESKAAYRLPTHNSGPIKMLAVNVTITGRHPRRIPGTGIYGYRCRVTFVGDGEPNVAVGAWIAKGDQ